MSEPSPCDYCDKPVDYPLPVHPECARIWLMGFHAGSKGENLRPHPQVDVIFPDELCPYEESK